jgi:dimethylglycine dehydrogenase
MHCGASIGICQGGGAGKFLAQWMVHGQAEINMREFDPRRFGNWATAEYTCEVAVNDYHHMYHCLKPGEQHEAGRNLRMSSVHERLKAHGAQFSQVFGWERARWYAPANGEVYSFKRSNWWAAVKEETLAVREHAGLMDLSTFSKFDVTGRDAYAFLERICANRIPQRDAGIVLGHLLTEAGFIESEITVTRLGREHFYVLSAAVAQLHDLDQFHRRLNPGEQVTIKDVTDDFGCLVLAGPKSREVLSRLTATDLTNAAFRWLTGKEIEAAGVKGVRALRVNYVGELGWELHVPMAKMPAVFDALMEAGKAFGLRLFGTYAMNSLRMEKAYRGWGSELTNEIDMFEGSMERFIRLDKGEFIGRQASLSHKQRGERIKLVYLTVEAADSDVLGNEPIYLGERLVGLTTSGAYGHAVKKSLAFGYVEPELGRSGEELEILMLGERRKARIIPEPAYDPANERLKE